MNFNDKFKSNEVVYATAKHIPVFCQCKFKALYKTKIHFEEIQFHCPKCGSSVRAMQPLDD